MRDSWSHAPNGGEPPVYFERKQFQQRINEFGLSLREGRFATGLVICGSRGVGKTLELNRLHSTLLVSGVIPLKVVLGGRDSMNQAIGRSLNQALGERQPANGSGTKWTVGGKIPFTPVEISFERDGKVHGRDINDRLLTLAATTKGPGQGGVALLIDEADAIVEGEFSDNLSELLEYASSENAPVGVVVAGLSRDVWQRTAQGKRSYAEGLFDPLWLPRLDETQSRQLLVETAASLGLDWKNLDLSRLVTTTYGVPRRIHAAGQDLWRRLISGVDPNQALEQSVAAQTKKAATVRSIGLTESADVKMALSAMKRHGFTSMTTDTLVSSTATEGSAVAQILSGLEELASRGIVEIDFWDRITALFEPDDIDDLTTTDRQSRLF